MIGAEAGTGDGVIGDSIPFVSFSIGTGTEAGAGAEEPAPQAPPNPIPIAIPPLGASRSRHQALPML